MADFLRRSLPLQDEYEIVGQTDSAVKVAAAWDSQFSPRAESRGSESVVLVALDEWNGLLETAHLLRSPANAKRLLGALQRLNQGDGLTLTQAQLHEHTLAR